jgi:hypothetical protein
VWKNIRRGWEVFSRFILLELGDRFKFRLCHYLWCGDQPLKANFLELFSIACHKGALVVEHVEFINNTL